MKWFILFFMLLNIDLLGMQISEQQIDYLLSQDVTIVTSHNKIIKGKPTRTVDGSISIRTPLEGGYSETPLTINDVRSIQTPEDQFFLRQNTKLQLSLEQLTKIFNSRSHLFPFMDESQITRYLELVPKHTAEVVQKWKILKLLNILKPACSQSSFRQEIIERQAFIFYELNLLDEVEKCLEEMLSEQGQYIKISSFTDWMPAQVAFERKKENALQITLRSIINCQPQARRWQDRLYMLGIHQLTSAGEITQGNKLLIEMEHRDFAWDQDYLPFPEILTNNK